MARDRLGVHKRLESLKGLAMDPLLEAPAVYFQPPPSVQLVYPCVIYNQEAANTRKADSIHYVVNDRYTVILIDKDPDTTLPDQFIRAFPRCIPDRDYVQDNLYHYSFTLYD